METPILFLVFNRPEITRKTFMRIRSARPKQLFVAADGPRQHVMADAVNCQNVRDIVSNIDWDCDVKYLFREKNMGCGKAVSSAISWFFDNVERGIILEDDCYPSDDFFPYMEALLERYADNDRVMMVSGCSFQNGQRRTPYSYFFSRCCHIWGWGTWRSAWQKYDLDMKTYAQFRKDGGLENILDDSYLVNFWYKIFDKMSNKEIDTWDYQWVYTILSNDGLSVYPEVNMVTNIGFGAEGTHTMEEDHPHAMIPVGSLGELHHPAFIFPDRAADHYTAKDVYRVGPKQKKSPKPDRLLDRLLKRG